MINTTDLKQVLDCPYCETGKADLTIDPERVEKFDKKHPWIIYKCDNCDSGKIGFTTTESDTVCYANIMGVELVQPEGFEGVTRLPWHLSEKGFSRKGDIPTIYATGDDLEMITTVSRDPILMHKVQDNLMNAKYILEACNKYPILQKENKELKEEIERLKEIIKTLNV
jgi:hypothetical protein